MKTLLLLAAASLLAMPMVATLTSCTNSPVANAIVNTGLEQAQVELELRQAEYNAALLNTPASTPAEIAARDAKLARLSANVRRAEALLTSIRNAVNSKQPINVQPTSAFAGSPPGVYRSDELAFTYSFDYIAHTRQNGRPSAFTRPDNKTRISPPAPRWLAKHDLRDRHAHLMRAPKFLT